jgi:predicted DNA-binding protein with PD1-like motif
MVKNAALSFYKGRGEYETTPLAEEAELCSLSGNISTLEGDLVIHAHAVVGKRGGGALAGHLSGAEVHMTAEVAILATPQKLTRRLDSRTGLKTLTLG